MEVICALLVLGCAFLLSFLANDSATTRAARAARLSASTEAPPQTTAAAQVKTRSASALLRDKARKDELIRTVETEPDAVADTLKQWIQE